LSFGFQTTETTEEVHVIYDTYAKRVGIWVTCFVYRYEICGILTKGVIEIGDIINEVWAEVFKEIKTKDTENEVRSVKFKSWLHNLVRNVVWKKIAYVTYSVYAEQVSNWVAHFAYRFKIGRILTRGGIDIDDIIQDVWVEIFNQIKINTKNKKRIVNFKSWLHNLVRNVVCEEADKILEDHKKLTYDGDKNLLEKLSSDLTPPNQGIEEEEIGVLLSNLGIEEKEISVPLSKFLEKILNDDELHVVKQRIKGVSTKHIAESIGCSQDTIQSRIRKAKRKIREKFLREGWM